MRIAIILLLSISISSLSCAQIVKTTNKDKIAGSYTYVARDSLSGVSLDINKDGSFSYVAGSDMNTMHTSGRWSFVKDTLIITSAIDQKNIPISVKEEIIDSIKENIKIGLPNNLDGEPMDDAAFKFNGDTTTECMPFWDSGCNIAIGSIDSLRLELNNGASSRWIKIKNKKANHLIVTVGIHGMLGSYLFLANEKYLYMDGKLYPLPVTEVDEFDMRNGRTVKRIIALKKTRK